MLKCQGDGLQTARCTPLITANVYRTVDLRTNSPHAAGFMLPETLSGSSTASAMLREIDTSKTAARHVTPWLCELPRIGLEGQRQPSEVARPPLTAMKVRQLAR